MSLKQLQKNMIVLYGDEGQKWLDALPNRINQIVQTYELMDLSLCEELSFYYVAKAEMKKKPIVLKIGYDTKALQQEHRALKAFQGFKAVEVLESGDDFLILEQAIPGTSLATMMHHDRDIEVFCMLMNRLHKANKYAQSDFKSIKEWFMVFDASWDIPEHFLYRAKEIAKHLEQIKDLVLLHGDLHHDNMLKHENTWKVIDPKGIVGPRIFEVGVFIINPIRLLKDQNERALEALFERRIQKIARLQKWDQVKVVEASFVYVILSWIWALQDGVDFQYQKKCAHILYKI